MANATAVADPERCTTCGWPLHYDGRCGNCLPVRTTATKTAPNSKIPQPDDPFAGLPLERRCEVCGRPSEAAWCRSCTAGQAREDRESW